MPDDTFVALGVITSPHGVKGALKLKPFTQNVDGIGSFSALQTASGDTITLSIIGESKGQLICQIDGVRYRDEAEKLKGTKIGVPRSALPEPDTDEFYIEDLIGMQVVLEDGSAYGTVKAIHNFGAGDIVELTTAKGDEMVSLTEDNFPSIDTDKRVLTICPPEILAANT